MNSPVNIKGSSFSNSPPLDILPPGVEHLPQPKVSKGLQFLELVEVLEVLYPLVQLHKLRLVSIQVSGHAIQRHSVVVTKVELVVRNNSARMYILTVGTVHITYIRTYIVEYETQLRTYVCVHTLCIILWCMKQLSMYIHTYVRTYVFKCEQYVCTVHIMYIHIMYIMVHGTPKDVCTCT